MQSQRSLMTSPMRRPVMTVASQPTETSRRSHRTSPRERGGVLPQRTPPGHQRHRYQGDLWDMGDPARPHDLGLLTEDGDLEGMSAVAFSPNGRFLAASGPNEVVLWTVSDPARPQRLMAITGYSGRVNMIAFAPDGSRLATSAGENEVHMWDVGDPATPRHLTTSPTPSAGSRQQRSLPTGISWPPGATTRAYGMSGEGDRRHCRRPLSCGRDRKRSTCATANSQDRHPRYHLEYPLPRRHRREPARQRPARARRGR